MPRRIRSLALPGIYHITHRCHNREYLFKFSKHRDIYCSLLLKMSKQYPVSVLNYMVTSNHVHLLLSVKNPATMSGALNYLHSQAARQCNKAKKREGAFWTNRFYSTMIQDGAHLGKCLFYIDMNMIRAGAVDHPSEWRHTAYHEFVGVKRYKRIIDFPRLLKALCFSPSEIDDFKKWYIATLEEKLSCSEHGRELYWSSARAVGDESWLNSIEGKKKHSGIREYVKNQQFYLK